VGRALTPLLQENGIGDGGAGALAEALEHNGSLATLDLRVRLHQWLWRAWAVLTCLVQYNGIGDDGARALAAALGQNHSLTMLHLAVRLQRWRWAAMVP
jgi:hypothetical protein